MKRTRVILGVLYVAIFVAGWTWLATEAYRQTHLAPAATVADSGGEPVTVKANVPIGIVVAIAPAVPYFAVYVDGRLSELYLRSEHEVSGDDVSVQVPGISTPGRHVIGVTAIERVGSERRVSESPMATIALEVVP